MTTSITATLGTPVTAIAQSVQQGMVQSPAILTPQGALVVTISGVMNAGDIGAGIGNGGSISLYPSQDGLTLGQMPVVSATWTDAAQSPPPGWDPSAPFVSGGVASLAPYHFAVISLSNPLDFGLEVTFE